MRKRHGHHADRHHSETGNCKVDVSEAFRKSPNRSSLDESANHSHHHKNVADLALIKIKPPVTHLRIDDRDDRESRNSNEIRYGNDAQAPATGLLKSLSEIDRTLLARGMACRRTPKFACIS